MNKLSILILIVIFLSGCGVPQLDNSSYSSSSIKNKKSAVNKNSGNHTSSIKSDSGSLSNSNELYKADNTSSHAQKMRDGIVEMFPEYSATELQKIPDSVINSVTEKMERAGADAGSTGRELARLYPNILSDNKADKKSSSDLSKSERANSIRELLIRNQGFNRDILNSISDDEILSSTKTVATNAGIAESATNLLLKYPNLKDD
ncbi:hypothetical protein [Latilactobacillus sakei]|uniref:hypothetical protein n=1 Tax=Latilactobacillus sakei TaxID=1599 RepID=UPI0032D57CF6